jgi:hypothetical protein
MSLLNLLNTELGAKARAFLVALAGAVTALILLLQEVADTLDMLPDWGPVGGVLAIITAIVTFLGRFTSLGNPKVEGDE